MLLGRDRARLSGATRGAAMLACLLPLSTVASQGQAAPASAAVRQVGTVTAVSAAQLTLSPDKGDAVTVSLSPETRVLDLPPGSTDLKAAQTGTLDDVTVGDRVLVTSLPAAAGGGAMAARRIVVMKSGAIAQQRQAEQAGWAHSHSGTVETVDASGGRLTISSRGRTLAVLVTPATIIRRYATDSARFEDAKRSTLADVHTGDQVRVRGELTGDTVQAAELVCGSFTQISGKIVAVDSGASTLTVEDQRTKKTETVRIAARTEIHQLPPEMAAAFAARSKAGGHGGAAAAAPAGTSGSSRGEADLGQAVAHLPEVPLSDLHAGGSVLLVAGGSGGTPTALTVLTGVEPILAASASGGAETALEPWSVGGGENGAGSTQ